MYYALYVAPLYVSLRSQCMRCRLRQTLTLLLCESQLHKPSESSKSNSASFASTSSGKLRSSTLTSAIFRQHLILTSYISTRKEAIISHLNDNNMTLDQCLQTSFAAALLCLWQADSKRQLARMNEWMNEMNSLSASSTIPRSISQPKPYSTTTISQP